ncbi:hypothetical protein Nepgr_005490 [Nepenthes gracilis]|uniref:EGF-like domain-containing protein n=1 Tax=Nepenthes gracilis TaxID=150966 RepID=A0AAD3S3L9_NEPGR|nr:hypothetical protein Nepgr_005490 [Nepenthes gracilis]
MKRYHLKSVLSPSQLLLFSITIFFNLKLTLSLPPSDPLHQLLCGVISCGAGKCVNSNSSIFGVDCVCNSGWKKIQLGPLTFPSCIVPNCSVDFKCSSDSPALSPSLSPPPPPPPTAFLNFSNPCAFVWCGDGTCKVNGTGYTCDCNDGSENLLHSNRSACFKPCYLGADCVGLNINFANSPPPLLPPSPPPNNSRTYGHGLRSLHAAATVLQTMIIIILWW